MPREDDPAITGDVVLYRRIPHSAERVTWGEDGQPTPNPSNFRDRNDELSMNMAHETTPEAVLAGPKHDGFGLIQITVKEIRRICGPAIKICRDDEEPANGHVLICGNITRGTAKLLCGSAKWVDRLWPRRIDPLTGEPSSPGT
jgi:hypothetical protein